MTTIVYIELIFVIYLVYIQYIVSIELVVAINFVHLNLAFNLPYLIVKLLMSHYFLRVSFYPYSILAIIILTTPGTNYKGPKA